MDHNLIYLTGSQTVFQLPTDQVVLPHIYLDYVSFAFNFHNVQISGQFGNTQLYLSPTLFITMTPGLYTLNSMNTRLLYSPQADLKYYSVYPSINGDHYDIYQYATFSDKLNNTNGIIMNVSNLSIANRDIYSGLFFYDRVKIRSNLFHVHSNLGTTNSASLVDSQDIIIPITTEPMNVQTYVFRKIGFENTGQTTVIF